MGENLKQVIEMQMAGLHNFIRMHEVIDPFEQEERAMAQAQPPHYGVQTEVVNDVTP